MEYMMMSSSDKGRNLPKRCLALVASFSLSILSTSVVVAQEYSQISEIGNYSTDPLLEAQQLSVNNRDRTRNPNYLSSEELALLSAAGNESNFTVKITQSSALAQVSSDLNQNESDELFVDTSAVPVTLTDRADNSPADPERKSDKKWFFTIYGGTGTNSNLGQTLTGKRSQFYDSFFNEENFLGLEVGRKITDIGNSFQLEVTGQARQHFNGADFLALETALVLRWHLARHSNFLNASLAVGDGLSYVTDLPEVESSRPDTFKKSNLLNYLLIETAFSLPKNPDWSLVVRLNHRSGIFGVFNGAKDGSNNLSVGIRHSF